MKISFISFLLLIATQAQATSLSHKIYCQDTRWGYFNIEANVIKGSILLSDKDDNVDQFVGLTVTVKQQGKFDNIEFRQNGAYPDLPTVLFGAQVDAFGTGEAISYDDKSNGTTNYKCGIQNLQF